MSDGGQGVVGTQSETRAKFDPTGPHFLWMTLRLAVFTVLTLGLYRFWMTARLRRYYWNAIRLKGDPFEYTGLAIEKFLGFLVALVVLAAYLTVVNLGLAFIGLISFDNPAGLEFQIILNLSLLASLPLIFFALYRARRYLAARTRWRGIRFGMEPAGWRYAGLAMALTAASVLSLGLLYPMQHFVLTRFAVDRTWFGDRKFHQGGRWSALWRAWLWVYLGLGPVLAGLYVLGDAVTDQQAVLGYFLLASGYPVSFLLWTRYNVLAFRYFWAKRTLGNTGFHSDISATSVLGVYVGGILAIALVVILVSCAILLLGVVIWILSTGPQQFQQSLAGFETGGAAQAGWPILAMLGAAYLASIVTVMALSHVFLARPILRRQVEAMHVLNADALAGVRQRDHDHAPEAGGFADALAVDVGTGF